MEIIADFLLAGGALGVALYCYTLSRRLRDLSALDKGLGGAVNELSSKVETMTGMLSKAETSAKKMDSHLSAQIDRGEKIAKRLELLLASMHDLPVEAPRKPKRSMSKRFDEAESYDSDSFDFETENFDEEKPAKATLPEKAKSQFLRHRRSGERIN